MDIWCKLWTVFFSRAHQYFPVLTPSILRDDNISSAYQTYLLATISSVKTARNILLCNVSLLQWSIIFSKFFYHCSTSVKQVSTFFSLQTILLLNLNPWKKAFPPTEVKASLSFIHGNLTNFLHLDHFANCTSITWTVAFH